RANFFRSRNSGWFGRPNVLDRYGRCERELLDLGKRLGGRAHCLDHGLDGVLGHVQGELAGLDLGDSSTVLMRPRKCLSLMQASASKGGTVLRRRISPLQIGGR